MANRVGGASSKLPLASIAFEMRDLVHLILIAAPPDSAHGSPKALGGGVSWARVIGTMRGRSERGTEGAL